MDKNSKTHPEQIKAADLRDLLSSCTAFSEFSEQDYCILARHAKRVFIPAGTHLLKYGDEIETAMVIEYGRCLIRIPSSRYETLSFEFGRGQPLGLATMIAQEPALGDIYSLRDSKIIHIHRKAFLECIAKNPELVKNYSKWTVEQALILIGQNSPKYRSQTFALLPTGNDDRIHESLALLKQAFSETIGKGHFLDNHMVKKALGHDPSDDSCFERVRPQLTEWLEDQEAEGHFLLFVCDSTETKWTQWCLDQTNRITVMAMADNISEIEHIDSMFSEREVAESKVLIDLILIQGKDIELPRETSKWTKLKCLARHHQVRYANTSDYRRVARWIGEKPIGLTLGGGGARGLAHIGVLQALEERGVPIDAIGGTSMGAVIAGAYAKGWAPQKILEAASRIFTNKKSVFDLDIPLLSILAGRKLNRRLRSLFGDIDISDLWLPYFCISASLSAGEMIVHDRGPLWKYVRASCSLPGIFPPVCTNDHLLVDGGVMNNVPLDVMERKCMGGTVIAVNVGGGGAKDFASCEQWDSTGWRLLRQRLTTRRKERMANILDVMMWSTTLSSKRYLQQLVASGRSDLYLAPPVKNFELLGFDAIEKLYKVGYEYACRQLDEWDDLPIVVPAARHSN